MGARGSAVACPVAVHIGYHKTATTWFQQVAFRRHAGIVPLLGGSEFGVVASDPFLRQMAFARDSEFDAAEARRLFVARAGEAAADPSRLVLVSAERLSGHAASGGQDAARIAGRIHATLPEARVFWMVRHQAEAIRSEYKQLVLAGWPGDVRRTLHPPPRMKTVGVDLAYWEYDRLFDAYARRFGEERLLVLDYGAFTRGPAAVLDRLASFLGVAPWALPDEAVRTRLNEGESDRQTRWRQRLNHVTATELNPFPVVDVPDRVTAALVRAAGRLGTGRPLFDAGFDAWVEERYGESNRRLARRSGVALTRSGSPAADVLPGGAAS